MDLYPQDLGSKWHFALARARTRAARPPLSGPDPTEPPVKKQLGPLGKFWTGGSNMDADTAADGMASLRARTLPLTVLMGTSALMLVGGSLALAAGGEMGGVAVTTAMAGIYGSMGPPHSPLPVPAHPQHAPCRARGGNASADGA